MLRQCNLSIEARLLKINGAKSLHQSVSWFIFSKLQRLC